MAKVYGIIVDKETGVNVEARVQVITSRGHFVHPQNTILKIGPGLPFFYSNGEFEIEVPRGATQILVERGTEYIPAQVNIDAPAQGSINVEVEIERWSDVQEQGWYPGNTHIHYDEGETKPDDRLRLDPRIEDYRVTVISMLQRKGQFPASNKYPPGVLTDFCTAHHHIECGEESRHNSAEDIPEQGYGHIMLLRIKEVVEPISRGYLMDALSPDYPPLCYACDDAHRQGGVVIWCHNGIGMEAPIAAALGKIDAFNLFDPFWFDPEYEIWYAMLNCGLKLPASSGSDWFICNANRVYAYTGCKFRYEDWIEALKGGRTYVTNGPAIFLTVNDHMPGDVIQTEPGRELTIHVNWLSYYDIHRVELVWNGSIVSSKQYPDGSREGNLFTSIKVSTDGWIAARLGSNTRDSFFQPIWAHTSPIYIFTGVPPKARRDSAAKFVQAIEKSLGWMNRKHKYQNHKQREEVNGLFREGLDIYMQMVK